MSFSVNYKSGISVCIINTKEQAQYTFNECVASVTLTFRHFEYCIITLILCSDIPFEYSKDRIYYSKVDTINEAEISVILIKPLRHKSVNI